MSDSKFFLYIKKFLRNPLLARKQMVSSTNPMTFANHSRFKCVQAIKLIHSDMANVKKEAVRDKLATMLKSKPEAITVFGLKTKFGGGSSSGFALVYDS